MDYIADILSQRFFTYQIFEISFIYIFKTYIGRISIMSQGPATSYQINVHQIGQTVTWCLLYDISIICACLKYKKAAAIAHSLLGWAILIMTYSFILLYLIPYGFFATQSNQTILMHIHGIIGLCLMAFVVIQVLIGVFSRINIKNDKADLQLTKRIKNFHKYFGYFLAVIYKINIIWSWFGIWFVVVIIFMVQISFITSILYIKFKAPRLQRSVVDIQVKQTNIRKIQSIKQIEFLSTSYVMFGNYVYQGKQLRDLHPGGSKVIDTIIGRQVDRFVYGMYSSQLFSQLLPHSHSANCLKLVGPPIAKYTIPKTYEGFNDDVINVKIIYSEIISQKTQIYCIGLESLRSKKLVFQGYTDVKQLGQYYSLTLYQSITRLYTAVNFLTQENRNLMMKILPHFSKEDHTFNRVHRGTKKRQSELLRYNQLVQQGENSKKQVLMDKSEQKKETSDGLPIMLKIYGNGKFTSELKSTLFSPSQLKLSCPKGKGLQLDIANPGRIIVVAGGTGLFPFSDLIDLLFKSQILSSGSEERQTILKNNQILTKQPFKKFNFIFLIAINEPEDIHPITFYQLMHLSEKKARVVLRVSKNAQTLSTQKSKIEYTRQYFTKRLLQEAKVEGLSKIWICGPPKLNTETGVNLLQNGYPRSSFLFI